MQHSRGSITRGVSVAYVLEAFCSINFFFLGDFFLNVDCFVIQILKGVMCSVFSFFLMTKSFKVTLANKKLFFL